jgi:cob(I)alamin adenosyltransferase
VKIYTKSGDGGETGLFGGPRVAKDDPRVEAYGEVDELNSVIGVARSLMNPRSAAYEPDAEIERHLARLQERLFCVGAELATPAGAASRVALPAIEPSWATEMEEAMDRWEAALRPLRHFILPGGSTLGAALHHARAVCRRAERRVVALHREQPVSAGVLVFLNRVGDFLFLAARLANHREGTVEPIWDPAGRG